MTQSEVVLSIALTFMSVVLIPLMVLMFRIVRSWTRIEDDLKHVIEDKDKFHSDMLAQMTNDRQATDRRLRWLEEWVWSRKSLPNRYQKP